jgi:voltage-gated potassium channel
MAPSGIAPASSSVPILQHPRVRVVVEAAVVLGALATIPLIVLQERGLGSRALDTLDWTVWVVFVIDFLFILSSSPGLQHRKLATAADFAVVVLSFPPLPNLLALVRLARIVRLLRLTRLTTVAVLGLAALKEILGRRGMVYVVAITTLLILVGGGCLSILEPETVKGGYGDGIWWAVVTASTVGYGDIAPTTLWGRLIAVLLMLVGIGLMSTLAASITSHFVQQTANTEFKDMSARLERIEELLRHLQPGPTQVRADERETV